MQLDIFKFTSEAPLAEIMEFKPDEKISFVIGGDGQRDIVLGNSDLIKVYNMFGGPIDIDNVRSVYARIRFNNSEHEIALPIAIVKEVYRTPVEEVEA